MTATDERAPLPASLRAIADDFAAVPDQEKLNLLLEFSQELPELPERYRDHPDLMERVLECQSPVYLFVEVDEAVHVHLHATAPAEAPTTRGFASILAQGVNGLSAVEVLAIPDDMPFDLHLAKVVSPLRLRGMVGMLGRTKRQIRERLAASTS